VGQTLDVILEQLVIEGTPCLNDEASDDWVAATNVRNLMNRPWDISHRFFWIDILRRLKAKFNAQLLTL
jgi:hypothetical protein